MKFITILFTISLFFTNCYYYGQIDSKIEWSPDYTMGNNKQNLRAILKDDVNNVNYTVYQKLSKLQYYNLNEFILNKFSKTQEFIFSKTITLPIINEEKVDLLSVELIKGQLIVLAFYKKPKTREGSVIAFLIDKDGNLGAKYKEILTYKLSNNNSYPPFNLSWSKDKSKLLLYSYKSKPKINEYYYKDSPPPVVHAIVLDNQLNIIQKEDITIKLIEGFFSMQKCIVSDTGGIHLLYSIRHRKSFNRHDYSLLSKFKDIGPKILDLNLEGERSIYEIDFISNNNKLIFSGTFSDEKIVYSGIQYVGVPEVKLNQVFYLQLDETNHNLDFFSFNNIEKDILDKIVGPKKEGFENFNITNIFHTNKDNYYVIGEVGSLLPGDGTYYNSSSFHFNVENFRYSSIRKRVAVMGNKVTYGYNFQDIIVFKYNNEGKLIWQKTFEKNNSISSLYKDSLNENLIFFFNENPDNNEKKLRKSNKKTLNIKSKVVQVNLSSEGELKKEYLMPTYNKGKYLETEYFIQNGKTFYILNSGDSGGKLQQCWLKFKMD